MGNAITIWRGETCNHASSGEHIAKHCYCQQTSRVSPMVKYVSCPLVIPLGVKWGPLLELLKRLYLIRTNRLLSFFQPRPNFLAGNTYVEIDQRHVGIIDSIRSTDTCQFIVMIEQLELVMSLIYQNLKKLTIHTCRVQVVKLQNSW